MQKGSSKLPPYRPAGAGTGRRKRAMASSSPNGPVPHSPEVEQALVGACLTDAGALATALEVGSEASDFYVGQWRTAFTAIAALHADGVGVDSLTVASELDRRGIQYDRPSLLSAVVNVPAIKHGRDYASEVKRFSEARQLQAAGKCIYDAARAGNIELARSVLEAAGDIASPTGGSSWKPIDLHEALSGASEAPKPAMLSRTDGQCLLYRGAVHALNAEPARGKTWLALSACVEQIRGRESVVYVDFEDTEVRIVQRPQALGLSEGEILARFVYVRPDEPVTSVKHLEGHSLVVLDGMTEALSLHGLDLINNADIARFYTALTKPLARSGSTVLLLDHVPKDREARGRFGIGAPPT